MGHFQKHLFFCINQKAEGKTCCANHQAAHFCQYAKDRIKALGLAGPDKIRVSHSGCLGRCSLGPCLVIYPEQVWYNYHSEQDIDEIISVHIQQNQIVDRLLIDSQ